MEIGKRVSEKPLEVLGAVALLGMGIAITILAKNATWSPVLGSAMTAIGGALLSHVTFDVNTRNKAIEHLRPELMSIYRHLASAVTRMNRVMQECQSEDLESSTAIDRIAQLTNSFYGSVNDLHILVGSPPDFGVLVDTVAMCENVADRLEDLLVPVVPNGGITGEELKQLRSQLDSARMQLTTAQREFGKGEVAKVEEQANCPYCGATGAIRLGRTAGDSVIHSCESCGQRFHIHRNSEGKVFSRPWGGFSTVHMDVECVSCKCRVPLNFHPDRQYEDRYCMECCALLRITKEGLVEKLRDVSPLRCEIQWNTAGQILMKCPSCPLSPPVPHLWSKNGVYRGVCKSCFGLLQFDIPSGSASNPQRSPDR